jgi:hypothetical protein
MVVLELHNTASFKSDLIIKSPWLGRQASVCDNRTYHVMVELISKYEERPQIVNSIYIPKFK